MDAPTPTTLADAWPIYGLRIRSERLELRLPTDDEILALIDVAKAGIHPPDEMPFGVAFTDPPSPEFERGFVALRRHLEGTQEVLESCRFLSAPLASFAALDVGERRPFGRHCVRCPGADRAEQFGWQRIGVGVITGLAQGLGGATRVGRACHQHRDAGEHAAQGQAAALRHDGAQRGGRRVDARRHDG